MDDEEEQEQHLQEEQYIRESVTITSVMYSDVSDTDKRKEAAAAEEEYQSQSVTPRVGLSRRRKK